MKPITLTITLIMILRLSGYAIGERNFAGGRSQAMGGTSVSLNDFWSLNNNQAGLAWNTSIEAGFYFENRFLLKELMSEYLGLVVPVKPGTFGLLLYRFGNNHYSELKAGLSFSRKFGKYFSAAVQVDYLYTKAGGEYGSKNLLSCEIGLLLRPVKQIAVGVQIVNPVPVRIIQSPPEMLPTLICLGLSYRFSSSLMVNVEAEKDLENQIIVRIGGEFQLGKSAAARAGISTNPVTFTFGFGIGFGRFVLDFASAYHQKLGFSPSGSLIYSFGKLSSKK